MARPRTDIRPRIVAAARDRFLEEGVDGASLRTIAREAGTNVGMVFYYFPTKDELFLAVVEGPYARLLDDLEGVLGAPGSLRERLEAMFLRLGEMSDEELSVVRLVVREALLSGPRFERVFARFRRGHIGMILNALAEGQAGGEIDPRLPVPLALVCTFALGGAPQMLRRAMGVRPPFGAMPDAKTLAGVSADLLFRAIGAGAPPQKREEPPMPHKATKARTARAAADVTGRKTRRTSKTKA